MSDTPSAVGSIPGNAAILLLMTTETVMLKKNTFLRALMAAGLTSGLVACGGGSSSGTTNTQDQTNNDSEAKVVTGTFVDSPVGGLEYETASGLSGITNDQGEFSYNEGESVSFKIGSFTIGSSAGADVVSPYSLTGDDEAKAINIARFLQTLDDDGVPGNGIIITDSTRAKAANQNPTDVATVDLAASKNMILSLASENTVQPKDLVAEAEAAEHLEETLAAEMPVTNCGTDTTPVANAHVAGKTYGFIRSELTDKEINLMSFGTDSVVTEFHNDMGVSDKQTSSKWSVPTKGSLQFTDSEGTETFTACAVESSDGSPYYLILEDADGTNLKLYATKSFTQPAYTQSYILTEITKASDGALSWTQNDILTIDSELSAEFLSDVDMTTAVITNGALEVPDNRGQALPSTDELHLLAAQGKRIGIYLDFDSNGALLDVGTATSIPQANPVTSASFEGNAFVDNFVNEDKNKEETIINVFGTDGVMYDYHNDAYDSTGNQLASVDTSDWSVNDNTGELTETETVEIRDAEGNVTGTEQISETFRVFESAQHIYAPERDGDGSLEVIRISKTQPITNTAFVGTYNVKIPTENTVNNELVVSNEGCTYSGVACSWTIDASGKATLNFGAGETATAQIWQVAGSSDEFAFLITHSDDATDIEVGFMTRK